MRAILVSLLVFASCGDGGGPEPADMGLGGAAEPTPDIGPDAPPECPFEDEPDCTDVPCPEGDWVCVTDDPPDTSTCRLTCEDNTLCQACARVCAPLMSGGACVFGRGPGEPCVPESCNPGLDCIAPDGIDDQAFCRTRCGPGMPCVEEHFYCYDRRDGNNQLLGYTCGPYFGALLEGEDCTSTSSYCETGLLCATHVGGTTCVPMCYPDVTPDGCDMSEICQRVADEDGDPIGYGCL